MRVARQPPRVFVALAWGWLVAAGDAAAAPPELPETAARETDGEETAKPARSKRRPRLSPIGQRAEPIGMPKDAPREGRVQTLYDDGFYLKGEDDELRIGGWAQADLRGYVGDHPTNDTFLVTRARLDVRGVLEHVWGYRLQGNFVGERNGILQEAWLEYRKFDAVRVRVGQIKEPFSLESSMSVRWIDFAERASVVTAVEPAQDIGAMLYGTILGRRVDWAAGVFNGQGRNRLALGDSFETTGRFVVNAWRPEATAAAGLWVGGSFGYADNERDVSDLRLQTQGTTRFLVFAPDVVRHGPLMRWGGELELVHGPVSLRGEYVGARLSGFRLETETADLILHGGYANLACVLTGERAVRNGPLRPRRGLESGGPGAFRLAARYQAVRSDHALLDRGLAVGTSLTQSTTIGLDWFPNVHLRMLLNYDFAWFDDAVLVGNRTLANEHVVTLRAQFNF